MDQPAFDPAALDTDLAQPFILVRLKDRLFAISTRHVAQILQAQPASALPKAPPEIRGVLNVRGSVMPLIDLRARMNMGSLMADIEETVQILQDRENDHLKWLSELEASVREKRPFKLARDPHKCAFGKWYATYKPSNQALQFLWRSFEAPHARIHGIADHVCALAEAGQHDAAQQLIDRTRDGDLHQICSIFAAARTGLRETLREVTLVLGSPKRQMAAAVDEVVAVEHFTRDMTEPLPANLGGTDTRLTPCVMRRPNGQIVLMLAVDHLFAAYDSPALSAA